MQKFIILFLSFFSFLSISDAQVDSLKFGLKSEIIRALAASPHYASTYYAGLKGEKFGSGLIFVSQDMGRSWTPLNNGNPIGEYVADIQAIAVARDENKTIYAGTWKDGLYKSSDEGKRWSRVLNFPSSDIRSIKTGIQNTNLVYAATYNFGVVKSVDGGKTWIRNLPEVIENSFKFAWSIEIDEENDNIIYAQAYNQGIWKSTDQGTTWNQILDVEGQIAWDLKVDNNGQDLYVAASMRGDTISTIYHSNNAGENWTKLKNVPQIGASQINVMQGENFKLLLLGSWRGGVHIHVQEKWVKLEEIAFDTISEILLEGNDVVIGTWGDGVYRYNFLLK